MKEHVNKIIGKIEKAGISAKWLILPAAATVFALHLLIVVNFLQISRIGQNISQTMQFNFSFAQNLEVYSDDSDVLSDKARLYTSTLDENYLAGYGQGLEELSDHAAALEGVVSRDIGKLASEQVEDAMEAVDERIRIEMHALRLAAESVGHDLSSYPQIEATELSDFERSFSSSAEKRNAASALLTSKAYLQIKSNIDEYVGRAVQAVSTESARRIQQQSAALSRVRMAQLIVTVMIITIMILLGVLIFLLLIDPLERSVERIQAAAPLPADRGLLEFRRLAYSYNELLHHRNMMEGYLRKQSQTDALTQMPNRLAFQNHISQLIWETTHASVTVFSLDVNGLKEVNDTEGHASGDALLRRSAECINSVFGGSPERRCFRFGGDEFAAFWVGAAQEEADKALARFVEAQRKYNVSISVGSAHVEDLSETTVEALFEQADKSMYADKARHHRTRAAR